MTFAGPAPTPRPPCSPRSLRLVTVAALVLLVPAAVLAATAQPAVVVELFTAQGCSSCPPADRLLSAMGKDPDLGKQVVPLAFHVDYWNKLGWYDRFSDAAWTKRQADYVRGAGGKQVYTPQVVVGGRTQCVGSDVQCIKNGVESAAAGAAGKVELSVAAGAKDALAVTVIAEAPAGVPALDVMVAVFESGLETDVKGGENAKKVLREDFVVRRLQRAFKLSGDGARRESVTLELDRGWRRENLGVAVFLQDPKTRRIFAGAASSVTPGS